MKLIRILVPVLMILAVQVAFMLFQSKKNTLATEKNCMLAHIGFYVDDLQKSDAFYRPLLSAIGYEVILSIPQCIAYGVNGVPLFEIYTGKPKSERIHIAFNVANKEMVEKFHTVALSLGGIDNGKPGYRDYFPNYYASFIMDPNGHNLEALFWHS